MKVRIYSPHCSRPEYILFQYNSIKKHIQDNVEYIVVNDGQNEATFSNFMNDQCRTHIDQMCQDLKIQCISFPPLLHDQRDTLFPGGAKQRAENYSQRSADTCQFILKHSMSFDGIVVMMDSDMFFQSDFSFEEYMKDSNLAYVPQVRQGVHYMWNNLILYKPQELPNLYELNFDLGFLPGNPLDAGGMTHVYLQKYKRQLKIREIKQTVERLECREPILEKKEYSYPQYCMVLDDCLYGEIPPEPTIDWQILETAIVHYGQGGNWNTKTYQDHLIKTKTLLHHMISSVLRKRGEENL